MGWIYLRPLVERCSAHNIISKKGILECFLDHCNGGIRWPIARTGWIDILFKSEPPHLQIIHNASWYCPDTVAHPRLPCHTPTIFYPTPRITLFVKRYIHHAYMHVSQGQGTGSWIFVHHTYLHPACTMYIQVVKDIHN